MHYARLREHVENMKLKREAEADALYPLKPVNLTPAECLAFEEKLRKAAAYDKDQRWAAKPKSLCGKFKV
jgi:hypothetical protein